ncbi:MAG: hypothetical protein NC819_02135 [Candidatus Omnitrophica bacterium]|nr:hypothetical protein [Candidatus Omnitrophota bacterium]
MGEPVLICWSGGKDSSLALQAALKDPSLDVLALVTTVTSGYDRISMHGVRCSLLRRQAESIGLPLEQVEIPIRASNEIYQERMRRLLERYKRIGVRRVIFGDLFLEEIRSYQQENLAKIGMEGLYPLWLKDTGKLAREFIAGGFKAVLPFLDSFRTWLALPPWEQEPALRPLFYPEDAPALRS